MTPMNIFYCNELICVFLHRLLWPVNDSQTCVFRLLKGWSILLEKELYTETLLHGTACASVAGENLPQECEEQVVIHMYPIVYRIDINFIIKVADFGLSESMYSETYFRQDKDRAVQTASEVACSRSSD